MPQDKFTVHWKEMKDGKVQKMSASFDTRSERDEFMATLPSRAGWIETYRTTDFEILGTFGEGDENASHKDV